MNRKTKIFLPMIFGLVAISFGIYAYSATAQVTSLGEVGKSFQKIHPQAAVIAERPSSVDGIALKTITISDQSETIDRTLGYSKSKVESGRATLELQHAINANGDNVVAATITNNGKNTIYLTSLVIVGQTLEGMEPLNAYIVDSSYSPEFFGNIPKPAIVKPITIESGKSYAGYISGKWDVLGQPIKSFSVGAVYKYDITVTDFVPDNNWSISVEATKLP